MEIQKSVESYLRASRTRKTSKKKPKFYISEMGKCLRMRWLKRKGIGSDVAPHVYWIFQIGDMYHDYVYKALEAQGLLIESEDYVENDHFIGRYDGLVKDEEGKAVLEIKSTGAWAMKRLIEGGGEESDIMQGLTYLMMLNKKIKGIKKVIYFYVNKEVNTAPMRVTDVFIEKHYRLTSQRQKSIEEEMNTLIEYWLNDVIPQCTCPAWMKNYNSFQPLCDMNHKQIKKVLGRLKSGKKIISTNKELYVLNEDKKEVLKV